jgi:hypothetical protein
MQPKENRQGHKIVNNNQKTPHREEFLHINALD